MPFTSTPKPSAELFGRRGTGSVTLGLFSGLCLCIIAVLLLPFLHLLFQVSVASSCGLPSFPWTSSGHMAASQPLLSSLGYRYPAPLKRGRRGGRTGCVMEVGEGIVDIQKTGPRTSHAGWLELLSHKGRNGTGMKAFA